LNLVHVFRYKLRSGNQPPTIPSPIGDHRLPGNVPDAASWSGCEHQRIGSLAHRSTAALALIPDTTAATSHFVCTKDQSGGQT